MNPLRTLLLLLHYYLQGLLEHCPGFVRVDWLLANVLNDHCSFPHLVLRTQLAAVVVAAAAVAADPRGCSSSWHHDSPGHKQALRDEPERQS